MALICDYTVFINKYAAEVKRFKGVKSKNYMTHTLLRVLSVTTLVLMKKT